MIATEAVKSVIGGTDILYLEHESMVDAFNWAKERLMGGAGHVNVWVSGRGNVPLKVTATNYWRFREQWVGVGS
jgi:hypothetical protein